MHRCKLKRRLTLKKQQLNNVFITNKRNKYDRFIDIYIVDHGHV